MKTKLRENETLILEVKKHWIMLTKPVFILVFCICLYFAFANQNLHNYEILFKKIILIGIGCSFLYFLYSFLDRKYNIWAITNQRVIEEWGIISYNTKESPIEKINNIQIKQTLTGRIMNYGNISIQTAATEGETWLKFIEKPKELQGAILEQIRKKENKPNDTINIRETRECPFCAEIILKKARICRYCGKEIEETEKSQEVRQAEEKIEEKTKKKVNEKEYNTAQTTQKDLQLKETADIAITVNRDINNDKRTYNNPHDWKRNSR